MFYRHTRELSKKQVVEAVKKTSSKAGNPDNLYGWGIPDAEKAVTYYGPAFSNTPELSDDGNKAEIETYVFSSFGLFKSSVELHVINMQKDESIYKMEESDDNFFKCSAAIKPINDYIKFYFKAKDKRGYSTKYPSGILGEYFILKNIKEKFRILN
ncbi:MAG: hypothetical protein WCE54_07500 [Ignavibacteriaceae bacterium]